MRRSLGPVKRKHEENDYFGACKIVLLLLLVASTEGQRILSQTVVSETVKGSDGLPHTYSKQRILFECNSDQYLIPATLQLQRADTAITDILQLQCYAPELSYFLERYSAIPLGTIVSEVPLVRSDVPNDYNQTIFDEAIKAVDENLAANGITLDSLDQASRSGSFQLLKVAARTNRTPNGKARWAMQGLSRNIIAEDPFVAHDLLAFKLKRGNIYKQSQGFNKVRPPPPNPLDYHSRGVEDHVRTELWRVEAEAYSAQRKLLQIVGPGPVLPGGNISTAPLGPPGAPVNPWEPPPTENPVVDDLVSFREIAAISVGLSFTRSIFQAMSTYLTFSTLAKSTVKVAQATGNIISGAFRAKLFLPLLAFEVLNIVLEFTGTSPVQQLAKYIRAIVTSLVDFGNSVINFQTATTYAVAGLNSVLERTVIGVNQLRAEVQGINADLAALTSGFRESQANFDRFVNLTTENFIELDTKFVQQASNQENITRILLSLIEKGYQQNDVAIQGLVQLNQKVDALRDVVGMVDRRTIDLRAVTALFHEQLNATRVYGDTVTKLLPFMASTGRKPLSDTQLRATKNVANAVDMAIVEIQGSYRQTSGATTLAYAVAYTLTLKCDLEFIANLHLADPSIDFPFDNIGPGNSSLNYTCSGIEGTLNPWFCNCMVVANGSQAQYTTSNPTFLYPWDMITPETSLERYYQQRIWARYPTLFQGTQALPPVYLDTPAKLANFLAGPEICVQRNWMRSMVRMVSPGTIRYSNITTDPSLYPQGNIDRCNATYQVAVGLQRSFNYTTIPQSFYYYMSQEFSINIEPKARIANDVVFGQMGQAVVTEFLGNMATAAVRAYRTYMMRFVSLLVDQNDQVVQLFVFIARYATTTYALQIQFNTEAPVLHLSYQVASTSSVPRNDSVGGNITITTDVSSSIIEYANLAPPVMPLITPAMFQCPGLQYFAPLASDPTECDFNQPTMFTDYYWRDIDFGPNRLGAMNYIQNLESAFSGQFQEDLVVGLNVPMNRSTFDMQNSLDFDPTAARNTPLASQRYIPLDSEFCQQQYNPYTQTLDDPLPDKDMCQLRKFFRVPKVIPYDADGMAIYPWKWRSVFTLDVPLGELSQVITSRCPDTWKIDYVSGNSFATITLGATAAISVRYSICGANYVSCRTYNQLASMGPGAPFSITITGMLPTITYYMQVWPYQASGPDPSITCFDGTGIPIKISANGTGVAGIPASLKSRVIASMSGTNLDSLRLQQISTRFLEIYGKLFFGRLDPGAVDQIEDLLDQIRTRANESVISPEDEAVLDEIVRESDRLKRLADEILNSTALRELRLIELENVFLGLINDTRANAVWIFWMEFFNNQTKASVDVFRRILDKMGDTPEFLDFLDIVPDAIETLTDKIPALGVGDYIDKLLGWGKGIAGFIGTIILVLVVGAVIWLSLKVLDLSKKARENDGSLSAALTNPGVKAALEAQAEEQDKLRNEVKELRAELDALKNQRSLWSAPVSSAPASNFGNGTSRNSSFFRRNDQQPRQQTMNSSSSSSSAAKTVYEPRNSTQEGPTRARPPPNAAKPDPSSSSPSAQQQPPRQQTRLRSSVSRRGNDPRLNLTEETEMDGLV